MSTPAPYVCTLDEATQKKALEELNEDPKNRQGAIDTFRTWILQQKHMKCPTDSVFLLAFLRARKFSQLEARRQLEAFMKRREKFPEWLKNLNPSDDGIQRILGEGIFMVLPGRDKEGRKVFILRLGSVDVKFKKYKKLDMFKAMILNMSNLYLCDEMTQVNGTITLVDFTGMTMAHQTKISMEDRKNIIGTWQKNFPARIKGMHMYNGGTFIEFILTVVKLAMSDKIQKRLVVHSHGLESVYKYVPESMLPAEYLPDDYSGPGGKTEKEIIADMKQDWAENSERLVHLSSAAFSIDMTEKDTEVPQASFRKLNVD